MSSTARTVVIVASPVPSATALRFADRDVDDNLDYTFDVMGFLADAGNDTFNVMPTITSQPDDLVFTLPTFTPNTATVFIGGGSLANPITDYQVTMLAVTAGGRTVSRSAYLRTTKLGSNDMYDTALSVVRGAPGAVSTQPGPPGRGIETIQLSEDGTGYVITFSEGAPTTVPVPPASALPPTAAQVSTALAALPAAQQIATLQAWASSLPNETTASPGQLIAGQDGYLRILPTS